MTYTKQLNYLDLILRNNKLPQALLFYGADAVRIKQIIQALIFRINTPGSNWADFDTDNQLSYSIKKESSPDVFSVKLLEDKKEIGIAQIRALKSFLAQSPLALAKKAAIIENAECLTEEAWNALLKALEEPAVNSFIFIVSSGLGAIPKTIASRAMALAFNPSASKHKIAENDIIKKLVGPNAVSLYDKFEEVDEILTSGSLRDFLDEWLVALYNQIQTSPGLSENILPQIDFIIKTKGLVSQTNANPKLMLERLILETHV